MKVEGPLLVDDPLDAGPVAHRLEQLGYDGAFTFEGRHDPFFPLLAAAGQTEKIELTTAVAIAFARNPMILAGIGYDLQLASKGRFILGLGTQIKPHIEKRFSMTWSKPRARMRELIRAIHAIWDCWEDGGRLDFRGEFYRHTLMTPIFSPGPNPHGRPRIFAGGVGESMVATVSEVADGLIVHPFHTVEFLQQSILPAIDRGLAVADRPRAKFEISCQLIMAAGETEEQITAAKDAARMQIAFYASTPAYRPVLDCHGLGDIQLEANRLSKEGRWLDMGALIDDELLDRIAIVGHADEVAVKVRARCEGVADRVSLSSPVAADPSLWADAVRSLHADG